MGCCFAYSAPTGTDGAERAGNQPASGSTSGPCKADTSRSEKHADHCGFARIAAHRGTDGCAGLHSPPSTKGIWRNEAGGLDATQHTEMELAYPVGGTPRSAVDAESHSLTFRDPSTLEMPTSQ